MKSASEMTKATLKGWVVFLLVFTLVGHAVARICVEPPAGLVGWWPGDGSGANISGADNEAVPQNGAGFAAGMVDQAFNLDGMDDFLSVGNPDNLKFGNGDFTVDAWVRFNATAGDMAIVDKMLSTAFIPNQDGWRLLKQDDNRFWFCFGRGTTNGCTPGGPTTVQSATIVMPNVWYHVAGERAGNTISLYVNGILEAQKMFGDVPVNTDAVGLLFGSHVVAGTATSFLNGQIDEVEIYGRVLSTTEIQAIFLAGSEGKCKVAAVSIDIKPGSFPNSINPRSRGKVPVAILTTDTFDATTVDPTTVRFGPTGTEAAPVHSALEDVDGDGDTDLIFHFNTQDTGIVCGATSASLTGETLSGQTIKGSDSIKTVGCK